MAIQRKVMAYRRENGKVGVRNHVIILPVDDISNACVEKVAAMVPGTLPLPHAYGRLQFGEDLDLFFRTMIGTGRNPNVAAVVVIGIEPGWTQRIVDGIKETGKPVAGFAIEGRGDLQTATDAARVAQKFLQDASELQRTQCDFKDLYISVKCGESDTTTGLSSCPTVGNVLDKHCDAGYGSFGETSELTGGEHIVKAKAANKEVEAKFTAMFEDYQKLVFDQKAGTDLSESQPTKGNIAGGLTTIEEKALGNIEKLGKRTKFIDALKPAEEPKRGPGLYFMDTSSAAAEAVTLWMASGAVIHLFPTGQGNVIGNPVEPVIKISGNPKTVASMKEHIDHDVSAILRGEMTVDQAGDQLIDIIARTANGRLTCAEALGHREYVMTKLYRSA
ncbi:MAG TPA: UxaA family hydrolase [Tepidisphaeraceae bacterium]|jgi:(2R)-sulfolactate sulfo-lyase subunit beta